MTPAPQQPQQDTQQPGAGVLAHVQRNPGIYSVLAGVLTVIAFVGKLQPLCTLVPWPNAQLVCHVVTGAAQVVPRPSAAPADGQSGETAPFQFLVLPTCDAALASKSPVYWSVDAGAMRCTADAGWVPFVPPAGAGGPL